MFSSTGVSNIDNDTNKIESLFEVMNIDAKGGVATLVNFPTYKTTLLLEFIDKQNRLNRDYYEIKLIKKHPFLVSEKIDQLSDLQEFYQHIYDSWKPIEHIQKNAYFHQSYFLRRKELNCLLKLIDERNQNSVQKAEKEIIPRENFFTKNNIKSIEDRLVREQYGYKVLRDLLVQSTGYKIPKGLIKFKDQAEYKQREIIKCVNNK